MANKKITRIIRENYPLDYRGYQFITLIQFGDEKYLSIVDKVTEKTVSAYVLDMCPPHNVEESRIIEIAIDWYENNYERYPISFEFVKQDYSLESAKIYRSFNVDFVERVVGPLPEVVTEKTVVKRKKRKKFTSL